jgi:hypothetical protein
MIPYGLALILVMLGVAALVAVARQPRSVIRSRSLDRAENSPGTHRVTSRDRPHCDACRYERERAKLAGSTVRSDGGRKRHDIRRIAPRQHASPDPGGRAANRGCHITPRHRAREQRAAVIAGD